MGKRNVFGRILVGALVLLLANHATAGDELWSRGFLGSPSSGPFRPFNVVIIESVLGNHLMATCSFANYSDESDSPPPVTIQGVKKDGKFYPHVFAKVTNDVNGEWKTIGELGVRGKPASRRIAAKTVDDSLTVQLDVFRPQIGTFVYGSVVLPTGEAAVFELNDLLPPEQEAGKDRNQLTKSNSKDTDVAMSFTGSVVAETPPSGAPISRADIQRISRAVREVTKKTILMIASVLEDSYVPGAITGNAYEVDTNTGKRTPQYIRTDLVSVYMGYTDRSHIDVYTVRKVRGRWKIESKKDWFL